MRLWRILLLVYSAFVVYGTTIPFRSVSRFALVESKLARIQEDPLAPIDASQGYSAPDIVQNLALFAPFGVLGVLAAAQETRWGVRRVVIVTTLAAGLALAVETLQLFTSDRTASLIDAATDTLGACLGAIAANRLRWTARGALDQVVAAGWLRAGALFAAMVAAMAVVIAAWVPFDPTLDVGMIVPKVRMLGRDAWQYSGLNDEGVAVVQYAFLAVAVAAWLAEIGQRNAARTAMVLVVGLAFALEATQIIIMSRMPSLEDATVHAGGAVLGAWLWTIGRQRPVPLFWLSVVIIGTGVAATIQALGTSEMVPTRRLYRLLYLGTYERSAIPAFSHLTERMLAYVPLGFVAGHILVSMIGVGRAIVGAVVIAAAIALPIAFIQEWTIAAPDVPLEVGFGLTGAWLGAWAATLGASMFGRAIQSWHVTRAMDNPR